MSILATNADIKFCDFLSLSGMRMTRLAMIVLILLSARESLATESTFNLNALEIDNPSNTPVDLSQFSSVGGQAPGFYRVDIFMNGELQDTRDVNFIMGPDGKLLPQLTPAQLEQWGVMLNSIPSLLGIDKNATISDISHYIQQAGTDFDFSHQALNISVPQASMRPSAQGAVDPKFWDEGIPALLLDYNFTGANSWQDKNDGTTDNYFLNLRSGANFGAWRFRNYSTWSYNKNNNGNGENEYGGNDSDNSKWDSINTYVQRDIPAIKGQFTAGDSYTPADVFESVQFRGAQIASDDNMLPDSLRGFAPTVRGIANSNAQVTIKQNGSVIYQTYVPPGAFTINDLYPTSSSGDLQVTIKEANGSERTFVQPFANVPIMQREGRLKYAMTVGEYRSPNYDGEEPIIGQATLIYGLPHDMTVYGGFQASDDYNAMALGMGFGLGDLGSFSVDATQAYTTLNDSTPGGEQSKDGQSYRFQYSKDIAATDSTVTLAGYRYSTEGFYTFKEAMDYRDYDQENYTDTHDNKRSKLQLDLTQNLMGGKWGSMSFSGYQQDYWNEDGYERNLSVSYSNSILDGITWTLMYTYTEYTNSDSNNDQQMSLNVSIPLAKWLPGAYLTNNMTNDMHGKSYNQIGLSGTALEDNNLSYNIAQGYGNKNEGYSGTVNTDYQGTYGEVNAGYNYNDDTRQVNYGAQGSLILHQNGLTLGQSMSSDMTAVALVEAPGASGVKVQNGTGVRTDWRGYTIVPYMSPYKRTRVALDPGSLADDVDLKENVTTVVPTSGAVVRAKYKTSVGNRVLMTLLQNGHAIPFGAMVTVDGDDENTGIAGEQGQVYLSGVPQSGSVTAKWGSEITQSCKSSFNFRAQNSNGSHTNSVQEITSNCS